MTRRAARYALVAVLAAPLSAFALVGGAGVVSNVAGSSWAGVGSLKVNSSYFTATLIAPGYVLTAAHVAQGAQASNITFQLEGGSAIAASEVFVNPGYTGTTSGNILGDPTKHADLAIIKLSSAVGAAVPVYQLFAGDLRSQTLTFASYAGSATAMKTGSNVVDGVFTGTAGSQQTYLFDFDGPDLSSNRAGDGTLGANVEASLVGGDSGSAAFVNVDGHWELAGINTFEAYFSTGPTTSGAFGTGGGGIVLSSFQPWIDSVVMVPVPEPTA
ncbi:MAG: hypothetical protein BWK72_16190 [Rhodoferax ferrireducens]|uniref:Peptidase S1 domain-containing protein n=1 Tax=Rhodoferax ferrireducens TaxID=192843 RepID=A0A1W9KQR4_9BURK|nr:MAG: hypothetical protein BWK72_16190 [Rhodoferax ferrireducens]